MVLPVNQFACLFLDFLSYISDVPIKVSQEMLYKTNFLGDILERLHR